ncbi:unnamed protein product [Ascophyllum nodosum]
MAAQRAVHSVPDIVEATFRAAVADHEDVLSLSALGKLLADLGRYGEAEAIFEKILLGCNNSASPEGRSDDDARALAMGWYAAMVEKNGSEGATKAEALYKGALRINEKDPLAMGNYAVFLHRVKRDHAAAAAAYKKAIEVHPSHSSILCKYGGFAKHVECNHDKAKALFEAAIAANPSHAESLGNLAVLLHGCSRDDPVTLGRIENLYSRAVRSDPANANNFSNYGLFLAERRKDFAGAEALYKKASTIDPFHANALYNYAVLLDSGLEQKERAEAMYRRCLSVNPEHNYALYNLAVLKEETAEGGDFSEVKRLFQRAITVCPSDALTRADYGRFLAQAEQDFDGAMENLREAMRHDPACTTAQFNLAKLLLSRERKKQAAGTPNSVGSEEIREAKALLRRVLRAEKGHSGATLCLARLLAEEEGVA